VSELAENVFDNTENNIDVEEGSKVGTKEISESAEKTSLKETYGAETETKENADGTVDEDVGFQEKAGLSEEQKSDLKSETGLSDEVINNINSLEEAGIYKEAGLQEVNVDGKEALIRDINPDLADDDGITNKEKMERGLAPLDENGEKIELHHVGQHTDSPLAELTTSEHRRSGNDIILHDKSIDSEVHGEGNNWDSERQSYWKTRAKDFD